METLFQSPPIIENIFKHLGARDLSTCAKVCKLWNSMSVVELKQRPKIDYFFQTAERDHMLDHEGVDCAFAEELKKQLKCLRIKSSFCIAFASEPLMRNYKEFFPNICPDEPPFKKKRSLNPRYSFSTINHQYLQSVLRELLAVHLPVRSNYVFAEAPGIIGCCSSNTSIEVEDGYTIAGFCLPKMPGVEFHTYDYLKCNLPDIMSEKQKGKCLLVFAPPRIELQQPALNSIIYKCLKVNPNLTIGGAILNYSISSESMTGKVIAISGENVEAASLILKKQDDKKEIRNKLKLFEETGLLKNQCFAFMFACVARGYYFHQELNFESSTFHSLYPKVPLIGVFGEGELGTNFLPKSVGNPPPKQYPSANQYLYSYSTIFVLISVKE